VNHHFIKEDFEIARSWCFVALNQLFQNSGEMNAAKIARFVDFSVNSSWNRKSMLCSMYMNDFNEVKTIFMAMNSNAQSSPLTRYIMFKIGLSTKDDNLGKYIVIVEY
jgi:hypothetical protein